MSVESTTVLPPLATRRFRFLDSLGGRLRCGRLTLSLPDGSERIFEGEEDGPAADLEIVRPRLARRLLTGGAIGFAEGYMDGDCETRNLTALIELAGLNEEHWDRELEGRLTYRLLQRLFHRTRPNSKRGSRRNIAYHYDLGNDFYRAWIGESMAYSSGIFTSPQDSLAQAQDAKYHRMAQIAGLRPDHHLLEVGCGWGGFAAYAAREVGCRVTAVTISREQFAEASRLIQSEGLGDKVEVVLRDYRDLDGQFDSIVSIEMLEAVGEAYWPTYFGRLRERLTPGGRAALQVITIADSSWEQYRRSADFIQRYIFPGGMLPAPGILRQQAAQAGLTLREDDGFGQDYAKTLAIWHERFIAAWPRLSTMGFDERFRRMWRYYLAYCEAGFRIERIDVRQIAFSWD